MRGQIFPIVRNHIAQALTPCLLMVGAVLLVESPMARAQDRPVMSQLNTVGPPIQGNRRAPAVAVNDDDGSVLVVWEEEALSSRVLGRVFRAGLKFPGDVFEIAPDPAMGPAVTWNPSGDFSVVWHGPTGVLNDTAILGRLFDAEGRPLSGELTLVEGGSSFIETLVVSLPQLAVMGDAWALVFRVIDFDIRFDPWSMLHGHLVGPDGQMLGRHVNIANTFDEIDDYKLASDPRAPEVVVVYRMNGDLVAERYGFQGLVSQQRIALEPEDAGYVDASIDGSGSTRTVWPQGRQIRTGRFLADGTTFVDDGFVDQAEGQNRPAIGALTEGDALVVWEQTPSAGGAPRLRARWIDGRSQSLGAAFDLGNPTAVEQRNPVVVPYGASGVIVAWEERLAGGKSQISLTHIKRPGLQGTSQP